METGSVNVEEMAKAGYFHIWLWTSWIFLMCCTIYENNHNMFWIICALTQNFCKRCLDRVLMHLVIVFSFWFHAWLLLASCIFFSHKSLYPLSDGLISIFVHSWFALLNSVYMAFLKHAEYMVGWMVVLKYAYCFVIQMSTNHVFA